MVNNLILKHKLIPVIQTEDKQKALLIAEALKAGGVKLAEITFRNANKINEIAEVINYLKINMKDFYIGAATVTNKEIAKIAINNGADFIISAGIKRSTVEYCVNNNIFVYPGIAVPSDIEIALDYNLSILKFFPAEVFGGVNALKAYSGPYPNIKFIVSGGINYKNSSEYLKCNNLAALSGSWITPKEYIQNNMWEQITQEAKKTVQLINSITKE